MAILLKEHGIINKKDYSADEKKSHDYSWKIP